jgi:hypothetical protein
VRAKGVRQDKVIAESPMTEMVIAISRFPGGALVSELALRLEWPPFRSVFATIAGLAVAKGSEDV